MKKLLLPLLFALLPSLAMAQGVTVSVTNAGTTGTTLNSLAKLTGAPSTAVLTATTDTNGIEGVVYAGAGTSGAALIVKAGQATCNFDAATTAGDYVQNSTTTAGDCHDAGATWPTSGQVVGRVLSTNASAGAYLMNVFNGAVASNSYSLPAATSTTLGGVIVPTSPASGTNLLVDGSGNISAPKATASQFGTVEPDGTTIIASSGVLSAVASGNSALAPFNGYQSGRVYQNMVSLNTNASLLSAGTALAQPWVALASGTIASLSVYASTASGSACNLNTAIYSDSGGKPGSVLSQSTTGNQSGNTTGIITWTFSQAITTGTRYWFVVSTDTCVTKLYGAVGPAGGQKAADVVQQMWLGSDSPLHAVTNGTPGEGATAAATWPGTPFPTSGWAYTVNGGAEPPQFFVGF